MERKKGPGRPPLLNSPPGSQAPSTQSSSTLPTANLPFPSLASGLGGINPSTLLSGLSLGGFDPKNNPLLLPFGGMSNMSALSGMSGLGNMSLTNSLFANLAGLGLPSLAGMDSSSLTNPATSTASEAKTSKSHKTESKSSTKATPVSSSASTLPTSLPFFFPNPSLLYTPLGLGGLNPFSLQPGAMSSAYDSLALLNGGLGVNATQAQSRGHKNTTSTTSVSSGRASTVTSASTNQSKQQQQQQQQRLPAQFLLPHDTHLLESLTRTSKPKQPRPSPYSREQEMKEALETLSKSSTELLPRLPQEDRTPKRTREDAFPTPVDLVASKRSPSPMSKKSKESPVPSPASKASNYLGGLDLSSHNIPEERIKTPPPQQPPPQLPPPPPPENVLPVSENLPEEIRNPVNDRPMSPEGTTQESMEPEERTEEMGDEEPSAIEESSLPPSETKDERGEGEGELTSKGGKGRKRRGKKSVGDVGQRKMLRSSAGRAAAAAARAREDHSN